MFVQMYRPRKLMTMTAASALGIVCAHAPAQFTFQPAANLAVGNQPSGVTIADFNGDGHLDVATTVDNPDRIVTLLNDGAGNFTAGPTSQLPSSSSPQDLIAARLDADGIMDLAVAVRDPAGAVLVMINNGSAQFTQMGSVAVGDRPRGLDAADIEPDGDVDLAVANRDSGTATVLTNQGNGTFTTQTLAIGGETRATAFGDFDADGDQDVAVTNHDGRTAIVFTNTAGAFSASTPLPVGAQVRPDGIVSGDLDNDGDVDLAVAVSDQTLGINRASVFLNGPAGFAGPFGYDTNGMNSSGIAAADLDCDGLLDLVTANADSNDASLMHNLGAGTFAAGVTVAVGLGPSDVAVGDLDGDGDSDVAIDNRDSNNVSVLINDTCAECFDVDGDNIVSTSDLLALLAAWGPNPGHAADFDGDGVVGSSDLLALLANWGPCI